MNEPVDLAYERFGEGRPIVILHGLFGSKRNWRSHARSLAEHYDVITVDLRNHGESPHTTTMDYRVMSADIGRLIAKLNLAGVDLVGHSMGGKAAMTFALSGTDRLNRLIIVDIAPRAYRNEYGSMLHGLKQLDLVSIRRRAEAETALSSAIPDPDVRLFILQNLRFGNGAPAWRFNLPTLDRHIDDLVGPIPVEHDAVFERPTFCLRGAHSDRVEDADSVAMTEFFPALKTVTIPAAGHWPHAENPAGFRRCLEEILAAR